MSSDYTPTTTTIVASASSTTEDSSLTPEDETYFDVASSICGGIMLVFCILGILGNATSVFVFSRPQLRSAINILLAGLSGIDLCVVVLAIPSFALTGLNSYLHNPQIDRLQVYNTRYVYPFACVAQSSSVWTFVLITIERYVAVCHPLMARNFLTIGRAKLALTSLVVLAFVYNAIRFFEYRLKEEIFTQADGTNISEIKAEDWLRSDPVYYHAYYTVLFLITHFLVPFTILTVVNTCAACTITRAKHYRRQLSTQQQSEHKTTLMMIVVILLFVFCSTLPFVLNLIEAVHMDMFRDQATVSISFLVLDISNTLVVINSASTCVIYYLFSQRYRLVVRLLLNGQLTLISRKGHSTCQFSESLMSRSRLGSFLKPTMSTSDRRPSINCQSLLSNGLLIRAELQSSQSGLYPPFSV